MMYNFNYEFYDFIRFISVFILWGMLLGDICPKGKLLSTDKFLKRYLS